MRYFFLLFLICNLAFGRNHFSPKGPTAIWDTSTAAGILNGSGNWTSTSELWTYENGGDNSPFCLGCNVSFGIAGSTGNAGVVTITGTQQINNMTFDPVAGGNYTLTGGTILCVNTPSCTYAVNVSATIASVLSGPKTLIKTGPGTLTLSGVNTYSGGTVISSGSLVASLNNAGTGIVTLGDANSGASNISWFSSGGAGAATNNTVVSNLGTGTVTIGTNSAGTYTQPSGTLTLNRATTLTDGTADRTTFTGKISGNVGTITIAAGRVTFGNAGNDFVGNLWVSNGSTYQNDSPTALPVTTDVTLNGNGQFRINNGGIHTINGLNGQSTDGVSVITVTPATLSLGNNNGGGTFNGIISNGGATLTLIKAGTGTQTLSGANTYTGSTTVNGGTLNLGDGVIAGNIIPAANLITNNATLVYNTPSNITHSGIISGTGDFTKEGTGTITFSGVNTVTGGLNINGGGITINSDMASTAFPNISLGAGTSLTFALNPGTWVSTAKNFSGSGTINLNANVGINNLNFNTDSNSTISMGAGTSIVNNTGYDPLTNFAGILNILGNFTSGANIISARGITGNGQLNHTTGTVTYNINGPGNSTFTGSSPIMDNLSIFNIANGITQTITGPLADTGSITKSGGGGLIFSGANTYSGATVVDGGNLTLNPGGSLNTSGITINNGGTMQFSANGNSNTIGSGSMPITVNAGGTLSVTSSNSMGYTNLNNYANITINGGTFNLTAVQYIGTLTLTNATVSGTGAVQTFFSVPTAISCTSNSTISSPLNINNSAQTINVGAGATLSISGNIGFTSGGSGAITKSGTGTLIFSGNNTYTANTTVAAGILQLGDGVTTNNIIPAANLITNNAALVYNTPSGITHSGVISGTGTLTKQGTGTLTLSGANTFTGTTTISAGTLYSYLVNALGSNTGLIIMNGGSLTTSMDADTTFPKPMTWAASGSWYFTQPALAHTWTVTGNWTINNGVTATVNGNKGTGRTNVNGVISGAGGIIYTGSTPVTVNGNNTYTGGTTISNSSGVTCGRNTAFGTGTVTVNAGAILNRNGCGMTNVVVNNGGTVNP